MNALQRRKLWRRTERTTRRGLPQRLVRHWDDLAQIPESETHRLEIDVERCNGWICPKGAPSNDMGHYLSTHTFYGSTFQRSTLLLRKCGFAVILANWDQPNAHINS
jgi:hypothetical protein